jgi:limonene-1,2-epoxide hydrolase
MALLKRKRSGLADPMSVVTRFVNACNRHDAEAVSQCLHAEFDSIQPMYPARNFRGADQVRRNWQAIFDAEPGFRLTVLRQAAADDTVWLELHGAGEEAEVAGVFVMGIEGDRVRWARIYSGLVEPLPPGYEEAAAAAAHAPLREVPPLDEDGAAAAPGEVVEEDLIAPVLDIDGGERRRRRRSRRRGQEEPKTEDGGWAAIAGEEPEPVPVDEVTAAPAVEAEPVAADEADEAEADAADGVPPTMLVEPDSLATGPHPPVVVEPEPPTDEDLVVPEAEPLLAEPEMEAEPEPATAADADGDALPAEPEVVAVDEAVVVEPAPETETETETGPAAGTASEPATDTVVVEREPEGERPGKWLGRRRR